MQWAENLKTSSGGVLSCGSQHPSRVLEIKMKHTLGAMVLKGPLSMDTGPTCPGVPIAGLALTWSSTMTPVLILLFG